MNEMIYDILIENLLEFRRIVLGGYKMWLFHFSLNLQRTGFDFYLLEFEPNELDILKNFVYI